MSKTKIINQNSKKLIQECTELNINFYKSKTFSHKGIRIHFFILIIFFFITVQEDNSGVVVVPELQVFSSLLYTLLLRLQVVSICSRDMIHNTKIGWSQRKLFMKLRHGKKSLLDYYNTYSLREKQLLLFLMLQTRLKKFD